MKNNKKMFILTKSRKKQLSELEVTMFEEFTDRLWTNRKHITHPKTDLTDEEMATIIHNVARLMNDYLKDVF
jgi:hypothetical protein